MIRRIERDMYLHPASALRSQVVDVLATINSKVRVVVSVSYFKIRMKASARIPHASSTRVPGSGTKVTEAAPFDEPHGVTNSDESGTLSLSADLPPGTYPFLMDVIVLSIMPTPTSNRTSMNCAEPFVSGSPLPVKLTV